MTPTPPLRLQLAGALLLSLALGWLGQWLLVDQRELISGIVVWAAAAAVLWMALRLPGAQSVDPSATDASASAVPLRTELALFALVMAVGVFFRLYRIDSIPDGLNHDSAWEGLYAIRIL